MSIFHRRGAKGEVDIKGANISPGVSKGFW